MSINAHFMERQCLPVVRGMVKQGEPAVHYLPACIMVSSPRQLSGSRVLGLVSGTGNNAYAACQNGLQAAALVCVVLVFAPFMSAKLGAYIKMVEHFERIGIITCRTQILALCLESR